MKRVRLDTVAEINPRKPADLDPDQFCTFVPMERVDDWSGRIVTPIERQVKEVEKGYTYFADGDVLFAKITPCMENGKCAVASGLRNAVGFGSTEFHVIRARDEVSPEWVYYFMRQEAVRQEAKRHMTGSAGQQRVPADFVAQVEIPLPPLPEQQRIAGILGRADHLRRLRRYALDVSDGYLQSVFLEMFGDRKRYELIELSDLLQENPKNGLYLPAEQYGQGTPIIRIGNFYDGVLGGSEQFKRVKATETQISEFSVTNGDILINRVNSIEYLGKCALVRDLTETTLFESNMMRVRIDQSRMHPLFFATYWSSRKAQAQILERARKAVNQASINQTDIKSIEIPLPDIDLQHRFVSIASRHHRLQTQQREALRQAEHLFHTLLHGAFA